MTTKRKFVAGLFIALNVLPWVVIVILYINQQIVWHEMEEKLEKNIPLHTITIPTKDIHWVKKNREIILDGRMFDIKTSRQEEHMTRTIDRII